jgi:hypothetical protein
VENATITDDPAWPTWVLCRSVLRSLNYSLRFPKNTDPRKTYQWRYVTTLASRFDEWGFDKPTAKVFLEIAAKKLGAANIRRNGLNCFFSNGLMEAVHKELEALECDQADDLEGIKRSHAFVTAKKDSKQSLLGRNESGYNLITWFMADRITASYLALSRSCSSALDAVRELDPLQADKLPTKAALFAKRRKALTDNEFVLAAKQIIGDDWKTC